MRIGSALALLSVALAAGACKATVVEDRAFGSASRAAPLGSIEKWLGDGSQWHWLTLPEEAGRYTLEVPTQIALSGEPACTLYVNDNGDRRIHLFNMESGRYIRSLEPLGRGRGSRASVASLAIIDGSRLAVQPLGEQKLFVLAGGVIEDTIEIPRHSDSLVPGAQVLALPDGQLAVHWFARTLNTYSKDWASRSLPLIEILGSTGERVASLGTVAHAKGTVLPAALNSGILLKRADSLFFLRASDGMLFAAHLAGTEQAWRLRELMPLPQLFRSRTPVETRGERSSKWYTRVERQVLDAAMTGDGRWLAIAQVTGWPPQHRDSLFLPRSTLVLEDRVSGQRWRIAVPGNPWRVAIGGGRLAVVTMTGEGVPKAGILSLGAVGIEAGNTCESDGPDDRVKERL